MSALAKVRDEEGYRREIIQDIPLSLISEYKIGRDSECGTAYEGYHGGDVGHFGKAVECRCSQAPID